MIRRPARLAPLGTLAAAVLPGLLLTLVLPAAAGASEPDSTVVKNRLYAASGRLELGVNYEFGLANTETATQGPVLDIGYHVSEAWAIDLLLGYMFGGPTDLAGQAQCPGSPNASGGNAQCPNTPSAKSVFSNVATTTTATGLSDAPNLWTLNGLTAQVGVRWEPLYGKLSLLTALPVHFKWYLGLDGGIAQFSRDSLGFCTSYNTTTNDCNKNSDGSYMTLQERKFSWLASASTGLRFIFLRNAALTAGLREYVWGDSYRVHFTAADFSPSPKASIATQSGITPSLFADLGLSWTF